MSKLWDKEYILNPIIEQFITGDDYILDRKLIKADCVASIAHVKGLLQAHLLTQMEYEKAAAVLIKIFDDAHQENIEIPRHMEDCHTAIESILIDQIGSIGEKIHTGRSRNDQVQAALRIYLKEIILSVLQQSITLLQTITTRATQSADIPMPGRTHLQIAMPSSVGLWLGAFAEQLLDDLAYLQLSFSQINRSPLGSAAGYGTPLLLDRQYVANILGFENVQNNVLAVQNSRGRIELVLLQALQQIALTISRFAEDMILYTLPEIGYFSLPTELCSGSSIMPQKKNPDVLELLRGYTHFFSGTIAQLSSLMGRLPTGYQRDLQTTKSPVLHGTSLILQMIVACNTVVSNFSIHEHVLEQAFTSEIYATDEVYQKVMNHTPFRSAYKEVAKHYAHLGEKYTPHQTIKNRTMQGSTGNPNFDLLKKEIHTLQTAYVRNHYHFYLTLKQLLSSPLRSTQYNNPTLLSNQECAYISPDIDINKGRHT